MQEAQAGEAQGLKLWGGGSSSSCSRVQHVQGAQGGEARGLKLGGGGSSSSCSRVQRLMTSYCSIASSGWASTGGGGRGGAVAAEAGCTCAGFGV